MSSADDRLLVAHVVYRFDVGGLENGVVNLINRMPADRFKHAVVELTEITDFRHRVERGDVQFLSMHKPPGQGLRLFPALLGLFRKMRPDIVHTRNLAPLEACLPAWLARVPARIHGEHGWDVGDLQGDSRKHQWIRRSYLPFVTHYVALSKHIESYLQQRVGVRACAGNPDLQRGRHAAFPARRGCARPVGWRPVRRSDTLDYWQCGTAGGGQGPGCARACNWHRLPGQ